MVQPDRGFPLMATGVPVLMMPIIVNMLMSVRLSLVGVLVAVMGMRHRFVGVLMLMFVLVMTAHPSHLLVYRIF
jgi:hypothetical protein